MKTFDQRDRDLTFFFTRDTSSFFAAAEEFAHLIDNDTSTSWDMTGTHAYSNKDNAGKG